MTCVMGQVDTTEGAVGTTRLLAQQALLMHHCIHPNIVPISYVGVQPPPLTCTPVDPTQVVYIASPWADMSLEKRLGSAPPLPLVFLFRLHSV